MYVACLLSTSVCKAHVINNYLGLPSILGEDLAKAFLDHLKKFDIEIKNERVAKIYQVGEKFSVQVGQEMITTKTVILATGVVMSKTFPGEDELLGKGVSYCATCDAALYKNKEEMCIRDRYILILIAHLNAVLLITDRCNIG